MTEGNRVGRVDSVRVDEGKEGEKVAVDWDAIMTADWELKLGS